jgi:eukaryotic-like serine/threonine-protein kinase
VSAQVFCPQCQLPIAATVAVCPRCSVPIRPTLYPGELVAGEVIDRSYTRYVVDKELGAGAMGTVYTAWIYHDPHGPRGPIPPERVAVKVLKPQAEASEFIEMFRSEAEALRRLDHPNVVRFIDLFEHRGTLALAMEFVEGDTLAGVLGRATTRAQQKAALGAPGAAGIPWLRTWSYAQQLLGGLAVTHALGIVHRDVKPANILIRHDGIVKLSDYGIADLTRKTVIKSPQAPSDRLVAGTGPYMSPEQVMGYPLDGRSDVYSACVVIFECLAGDTPFETKDRSEWLIRLDHVQTEPRRLRSFVPDAPSALDEVLWRGLAKNPLDRPQTAIDLGEALRVASGAAMTAEWNAQLNMASQVTRYKGGTVKFEDAGFQTLRDMIRTKYRTLPIK